MTASAHELTPTYPQLKPSHVSGIVTAQMQMFNKRQDVEYYEIGVFDKDWKTVPFVSAYKIVKLNYLGHLTFNVYLRKEDAARAVYICTRSRLRNDNTKASLVSSKICSRVKQ